MTQCESEPGSVIGHVPSYKMFSAVAVDSFIGEHINTLTRPDSPSVKCED